MTAGTAGTTEVAGTIAVPLTRRAVGPWLVALAVVIPTFMEVLDTTIANVALRYIAGGLSAPVTDGEWRSTPQMAAGTVGTNPGCAGGNLVCGP
jgi:hypothetical protein